MSTDFETFYSCKYADFELDDCYADDDTVETCYIRICELGGDGYNCEECKYFESKFYTLDAEVLTNDHRRKDC
jgi:hypothetical protein